MSPDFILEIFLILFALQLALEIGLNLANLRHVNQHADAVPAIFRNTFDTETYRRSVAYTLEKGRFGILSIVVSAAALLTVILSGGFGIIDGYFRNLALPWYWHGILYVFSISLLFSVISIPLQLYSIFSIEARFGFNKTTLRQWVMDQIKGLIISFILLTPLMACLFWFMDNAGALWWIYGLFFVTFFQVLIIFLYPVLIAPIFNKFVPLDDGDLKRAIDALTRRAGFATSGIFSMDGSKRSAHANAYFTGFGKIKRIVLFDTLISLLSVPQTVAVLAHEIGHEKKHHIKKMLVFNFVITAIGFWVLSKIIGYTPLFEAFGFDRASNHAALIVLTFVASPITYFLGPAFSVLSRRYEYQADKFANETVGNSNDLAEALLALSKKSLANLTPHPWYSFFHYSHPTLHERLEAMRNQ